MANEALVQWLQTRVINPIVRRHAGDPGNRVALLETIGRSTGKLRQTPVGNGLHGDVFWIVSAHGAAASYVRNLLQHPQVRIRVDGGWRKGIAQVVPGDDPLARLKAMDPRAAAEIRRMGSKFVSVRVDLDPVSP